MACPLKCHEIEVLLWPRLLTKLRDEDKATARRVNLTQMYDSVMDQKELITMMTKVITRFSVY
jgi:hypothetical protein